MSIKNCSIWKTKINPNTEWMGAHSLCIWRGHTQWIWNSVYFERASINTCHCYTGFFSFILSIPSMMNGKPTNKNSLQFLIYFTKIKIHSFFSKCAQQSEQFVKYLDILSFTSPGNVETCWNIYLPKHPSVRMCCKERGYACAWYRILFSWGISSVFKSDRVLAINDDAVFLGGRAALII